eukprot:TRINITY_DN11215_c0_g1_i1.p1 TRINITY_DN11215_c0_g1~~TRINITY_DN11215_c0_g1_i1.p1  ORF type:complete len:383 (+),score=127.35 TRINITY_DN11215_c0_g1_i1:46-1194(+)
MNESNTNKYTIGQFGGQIYEQEMIIEGNNQTITTIIKNKPVIFDISLSDPQMIDKIKLNPILVIDLPKENFPDVNINLFKTEPFESSYKVDLVKKVFNMQIKIKILPVEKTPFRIKFQVFKKTGEGTSKFLMDDKIDEFMSDPIRVISKPPQKKKTSATTSTKRKLTETQTKNSKKETEVVNDENPIKEISEKLDKNNEMLINLQNSFFQFHKFFENQNNNFFNNNNTNNNNSKIENKAANKEHSLLLSDSKNSLLYTNVLVNNYLQNQKNNNNNNNDNNINNNNSNNNSSITFPNEIKKEEINLLSSPLHSNISEIKKNHTNDAPPSPIKPYQLSDNSLSHLFRDLHYEDSNEVLNSDDHQNLDNSQIEQRRKIDPNNKNG